MLAKSQFDEILNTAKKSPSEDLESDVLEFKCYKDENALHNAKELAEEICALANHKGGSVIIGIRDSSEIKNNRWEDQLVGFQSVDLPTTRERIRGRLKPEITIAANQWNF